MAKSWPNWKRLEQPCSISTLWTAITLVLNLALGPEDIKAVAKLAKIPYDAHLMMSNPDAYIDKFADLGCNIIYVHAEAPTHLHRTLSNIRQRGVKAGVLINPRDAFEQPE